MVRMRRQSGDGGLKQGERTGKDSVKMKKKAVVNNEDSPAEAGNLTMQLSQSRRGVFSDSPWQYTKNGENES